ncbi:hypothetical protein FO519_001662 [Halicephalobus sp. NKZ332]|nr:hypothetical protein FO519_001662 [Halicephalobus sp. NKZ332]
MSKVLISLYLLLTLSLTNTIPVDNSVLGIPIIECGANSLRFRATTQKAFKGRIFVRGFSDVPECKVSGPGIHTEAGLEVPFDSPCRIDRERSANPRGIFVTTTVVVSFHPIFITKVDRAYKIRCIYHEAEKHVNANLGVNDLSADSKAESVPMPICKYELLEGGPFGHSVAFATVGTQIYHKWTCESKVPDAFCMLVHSCVVQDGYGQTVDILNNEGCAVDRILLNNLEYSSDLVAGQESHVYKYADRDTLFFQCQISLTVKEPNSLCYRPECPEPLQFSDHPPVVVQEKLQVRNPRQSNNSLRGFEVIDVSSELKAIEDFNDELPDSLRHSGSIEVCISPVWIIIVGVWMSAYLIITLIMLGSLALAKFPNEITETPIVVCEAERIVIKIRTTASNPSHIYAENYRENSGCIVRNMNKIAIMHGECGMNSERMSKPDGTVYRICVSVQIHPLFVTENDRSYCAQCVYMDTNIVDDLEQDISISDAPPSELEPQFDDASNPKCSYTIRKGSVDGPEIHFATIGESVYHVWQCQNEHVGILVQNCHVEDLEGNKILIIDQNGCGIDQYVLNTPHYSPDLRMAYQETHVFKFADKTMTRFTCQIRLCVKGRNNGCTNITPPPNCPNPDDAEGGLVVHEQPLPPPAKLVSGFGASNRGPPSITPPQNAITDSLPKDSLGVDESPAATAGSTGFSGYSGYRNRRGIAIYGNGTRLLHRNRRVSPIHQSSSSNSDLLPEMDVVGIIRVLDSPEDVQYYESQLVKGNESLDTIEQSQKKCMSTSLYWSLIVTLILLITIQFVALTVVALDRFVLEKPFSEKFRQSV